MTQANDQPQPASANPVEQGLGLEPERAAFEAWMGAEAFLARGPDGGYIDLRAGLYWSAWRARSELAAQEVAAERERCANICHDSDDCDEAARRIRRA